MLGKIALEEAWAIPENFKAYDPTTLAPKGVIGGDLAANRKHSADPFCISSGDAVF